MHDASVTLRGGNPGCGDLILAQIKVEGPDDRIADVMFEGEGCTISQAAASILSEQIIGMTLAEVEALDHEAFIEDLGREVVINRLRCATLALNTVKAAKRKLEAERAEAGSTKQDEEVLTF